MSKTAWNKLSQNTYILNFVNPEKWLQIKEFKDFETVIQFQKLKEIMNDFSTLSVDINEEALALFE